MKTAVETVFIGKERQFNRRFLRLCGHYLVEPTACTRGGLTCFPQFTVASDEEVSKITIVKQRILATLTGEEVAEWHAAVAQAEADGTFFIASPHHCALRARHQADMTIASWRSPRPGLLLSASPAGET